ncbi:MAG TPA: hypothetical protein VMU93_16790 [Caulobacteraceae bacterium]|nr:hypothetical protein [Caulobacteraceae bacterium]
MTLEASHRRFLLAGSSMVAVKAFGAAAASREDVIAWSNRLPLLAARIVRQISIWRALAELKADHGRP